MNETRPVTQAQARRIAVRAQALDGSATGVHDLARRLGFLQMDPIAVVARPEYLVLYSRLGRIDAREPNRLIWTERALVEWNAFIWPIEELPLLRARMRAERARAGPRSRAFLEDNVRLRRQILRRLNRDGPLLSRELTAGWRPMHLGIPGGEGRVRRASCSNCCSPTGTSPWPGAAATRGYGTSPSASIPGPMSCRGGRRNGCSKRSAAAPWACGSSGADCGRMPTFPTTRSRRASPSCRPSTV